MRFAWFMIPPLLMLGQLHAGEEIDRMPNRATLSEKTNLFPPDSFRFSEDANPKPDARTEGMRVKNRTVGAPRHQARNIDGLQRLTSEPSTREDSGIQVLQSKEFIRIAFPPAAVEAPGRPRIVIVDTQPGDVIDFASRSPQALVDEIDIPGLIAPDVLAIDKYALNYSLKF